MPTGRHDDPLELRVGETDRFFFLYSRMLATGDELASLTGITGAGVTLTGPSLNSAPLTYDGVQYAANTVAYVDVAGIGQGDKVEVTATVVTSAGRTLVDSLWIEGVPAYA